MTIQRRLCGVAAMAWLGLGCSSPDNGGTAGTAGSPASGGSASSAAGAGNTSGSAGVATGGSVGVAGGGGAGMAGMSSRAGAGGISSAGGGGAGGAAGSGGAAGAAGSGGSAGGPPSTEKFSFFVTSMASLLELAKAKDAAATVGFGGDLSYGETGPGAGLRGADKICSVLAAKSMPGNNKTWRAFLSVTKDADGKPVNAIDRVGTGPWYDRTGRVVATNVAGLKTTRPSGGDGTIAVDLPNEFGVPNHQPNPNDDEVDNHDTLTGSNKTGQLDAASMGNTCNDWTSKVGNTGVPRIGHSWPRSANQSWLAEHNAGGCAPGVNIFAEGGPQPGDLTVGAGGGYGGFYCFALQP